MSTESININTYDTIFPKALKTTDHILAAAHQEKSNKRRPKATSALLQAASRIFAHLHKIKHHQEPLCEMDQLRQILLKELTLFEQDAENQGHDTENIILSQYVLSAMLDEMIQQTEWGQESWKEQTLTSALHPNSNPEEHFFIILEKIARQPEKFIQTLEIIYLCLTLGFQGKYRQQTLLHERRSVVSKLYSLIRYHHGELDTTLSPNLRQTTDRKNTHPHRKTDRVPIWSIMIFSIIVMIGMYAGFNYFLSGVANDTAQQLQTIGAQTTL